ncbi:hypothetical protein FDP41_006160 [Naegleria fowleri]|uniref:Uncharacterized protein n=1 Tax=Naegleria fowleri TaxID=5763 RepID=A0A6A5BIQ0_NAEFO|nr:uncharacterized protein FDP41_006160 [Naegleria fowleri]KAF0974686.1 hypothetical protein FDP41_006160 [Naegleria fowleri]
MNNNNTTRNVNTHNQPSSLFVEVGKDTTTNSMMHLQSPPHLISLHNNMHGSMNSFNTSSSTMNLIPSAPADFPSLTSTSSIQQPIHPSSISSTTSSTNSSMLLPQKKRFQAAMKTSPLQNSTVMLQTHHHSHHHHHDHHHHQDGDSYSSHSSSSSLGPHSSDESELPSSASNAIMESTSKTSLIQEHDQARSMPIPTAVVTASPSTQKSMVRRRKQSKASSVSKSSSSGNSSNLLSNSIYEVSTHTRHSTKPPEPTLSFNNQHFVTSNFTFKCVQGFILNDSKKAPPDTDYNLTIRDSLFIESPQFAKCVCVLKLKDGSSSGVTVSKEVFKPNNSNNSTTFECTIIIPQRITSMKGSSSSRIGNIEILNQNDECVAVSSSFWIRSRSRLQLDKDSKRKQEPVQVPSTTAASSSDLKRKRDHDEDDSAHSDMTSLEPKIKSVKMESNSTNSMMMTDVAHDVNQNVVVVSEPHQTNNCSNDNSTSKLPSISNFYSSVTLESLFAEIQQLKQHVFYQHQQIEYLHQQLANQSSSTTNKH